MTTDGWRAGALPSRPTDGESAASRRANSTLRPTVGQLEGDRAGEPDKERLEGADSWSGSLSGGRQVANWSPGEARARQTTEAACESGAPRTG